VEQTRHVVGDGWATGGLALIQRIAEHAPPASTLVVESDQRFDFRSLIGDNSRAWDVREYPPAVVGIWRLAGQ
jgi:hypothetical protein